MNWVKAIAAVLVLWSSTAWGATLSWDPVTASDLAGYRVYQCSQTPCTKASGNASSLATLGTVTSINIGTPAVTTYYFTTAYDLSNNESAESNSATYTPASVPPAIGLSPASLSFTGLQGGANPANQTLSISNTGGGTLTWTAGDNAGWLTVSPTSGSGNGTLTASVNTAGLAAGAYNATITVAATGATTQTVAVALTVTSSTSSGTTTGGTLGGLSANLAFSATVGGTNPAAQTFNITNTGGGTLSWTLSSSATWLQLTPASGTTTTETDTITAGVSTSGLAAGTYNAFITVTAPGSTNCPCYMPVSLTLTDTTSTPVISPAIGASPTSFSFSATAGGANPATQTLSISNTGGGTLSWTVSDNATWLTLSPTSGTGNGGVTLTVTTGSLAAGSYAGSVTISATGASSVTVPVTFTVNAPTTSTKTKPKSPSGLAIGTVK